MPKFLQIPGFLRVSNVDTEVTMYDEKKDFHEVFKLAHESSRNSTGVDEREFPDKETVHKKINESKVVIVRDKANGALVSAVFTCPTRLVRSTQSPLCGGYLIVNELYRGARVGYSLNQLMMYSMVQDGYKGLIGRVAVTSRSILLAREAGSVYLGIIPKSLKISKWNQVVDDVIVYYDLQYMRDKETQKKVWPVSCIIPEPPCLSKCNSIRRGGSTHGKVISNRTRSFFIE